MVASISIRERSVDNASKQNGCSRPFLSLRRMPSEICISLTSQKGLSRTFSWICTSTYETAVPRTPQAVYVTSSGVQRQCSVSKAAINCSVSRHARPDLPSWYLNHYFPNLTLGYTVKIYQYFSGSPRKEIYSFPFQFQLLFLLPVICVHASIRHKHRWTSLQTCTLNMNIPAWLHIRKIAFGCVLYFEMLFSSRAVLVSFLVHAIPLNAPLLIISIENMLLDNNKETSSRPTASCLPTPRRSGD